MEIKKRPILTIGIPTFNRASILDECLKWVCSEVGNNDDIEIFVSDNASTDNTFDVVNKYISNFNNVVYYRQPENMGFDKNLKTIFDLCKGEYIKTHGDDDLYNSGAIANIVNAIRNNLDISVFFIHIGRSEPYFRGTGLNEYIRLLRSSNGITFLTSIIIKKESYDEIENKDIYLDSKIYQLYLQLEIIKNKQNYCIIGGPILSSRSGRGGRRFYNIGEVFINNYFTIMESYEKYGLDRVVLSEEKLHILSIINIVIVDAKGIGSKLSMDCLDEYFIKYYSNEPYFESELNRIKAILGKS